MKKCLYLLALAVAPLVALAQTLPQAQSDFAAGRYEAALSGLEAYLAGSPQDAEARFLKGLSLVMLSRDAQAIQVFGDLVRDYPELPEPYNNLAVLYARAGQYDKARDALESALLSHPSYATAHENLGDVYSALANAAYNRAQVLDKGNTALGTKLALVGQLIELRDGGGKSGGQSAQIARSSTPPPAAPPVADRNTPLPAAAPPAPIVPPTLASEAAARAAPGIEIKNRILASIEAWRSAWTNQNVDAYIASYSLNFKPATGISREVWESQRRRRVDRPGAIQVQVLNPEVTLRGPNRATVVFLQIYESNTYSDQVRKQIELEKTDRGWLIIEESVLG